MREKLAQSKNGPKNGLSKTHQAVASNAIDPKVSEEKREARKKVLGSAGQHLKPTTMKISGEFRNINKKVLFVKFEVIYYAINTARH